MSYFKIINCQFIGSITGDKTSNGGILGGGNYNRNIYNFSGLGRKTSLFHTCKSLKLVINQK